MYILLFSYFFSSYVIQTLFFLFCSFTITDMFGCSIDFKVESEYYVFASFEEYADGVDPSSYVMDFAVEPSNNNTPANFIQRMNAMKEDPPQCKALPAKWVTCGGGGEGGMNLGN